MRLGRWVKILLGLGVSILFLWLFLRGLHPEELLAALSGLRWSLLLAAGLVYFGAVWVRTWRWRFILAPVKLVPTRRLYPIYMISYMANNILPLRMGDIYRAYVTGKKEDISSAATLTTIAVERAFDGITMLAYLVLIGAFFSPFGPRVNLVIRYAALGFGLAVAVMYVLLLNRRWARALVERLLPLLPERLRDRGREVVEHLLDGLESLKGPKTVALTMLGSLATWAVEASMFHLVLLAFGQHQPIYVAFATMAVVNLGIIIPAGPGYVGTFEAFCALILGAYGLGPDLAAAYAIVVHAAQWIPSTLLGLVFMWTEHISFGEVAAGEG